MLNAEHIMTILSEDSFQKTYHGNDKLPKTLGVARTVNPAQFPQLLRSAIITLMLVGSFVVGTSIWLVFTTDLNWTFCLFAIAAYAFSSTLVLAKLKTHPYAHFGVANAITTIRAGISCLIGGALFEAEWLMESRMILALLGIAAVALCLDGIDGYIARRSRMNSDFGARYDMEVDAALILCLSILAFLFGKAGWWVMIIGGMRYVFVAAQYLDGRLRRALMSSLRRQTICVLQIVSLGIILLPAIQPPISTTIAVLSLATLSYSFGCDVVHLLRQTPTSSTFFERPTR